MKACWDRCPASASNLCGAEHDSDRDDGRLLVGVGNPAKDRRARAQPFAANAALNMSTTRQLLDLLSVEILLRRISGWESQRD